MDLGLIYDIRCKVICCLVRYVTIIIMAIYQHLIIEAWQPRGPCPPRDETKYAGYPGLRVNRLNVWNLMVGMVRRQKSSTRFIHGLRTLGIPCVITTWAFVECTKLE